MKGKRIPDKITPLLKGATWPNLSKNLDTKKGSPQHRGLPNLLLVSMHLERKPHAMHEHPNTLHLSGVESKSPKNRQKPKAT